MTEPDAQSFETYVRLQLAAILISVNNLQTVMSDVDGKADRILLKGDEMGMAIAGLLPVNSQTNVLLAGLTTTIRDELKETRTDLRTASKGNFPLFVLFILFVLGISALGNKVHFKTSLFEFGTPVQRIEDRLDESDKDRKVGRQITVDTNQVAKDTNNEVRALKAEIEELRAAKEK